MTGWQYEDGLGKSLKLYLLPIGQGAVIVRRKQQTDDIYKCDYSWRNDFFPLQ